MSINTNTDNNHYVGTDKYRLGKQEVQINKHFTYAFLLNVKDFTASEVPGKRDGTFSNVNWSKNMDLKAVNMINSSSAQIKERPLLFGSSKRVYKDENIITHLQDNIHGEDALRVTNNELFTDISNDALICDIPTTDAKEYKSKSRSRFSAHFPHLHIQLNHYTLLMNRIVSDYMGMLTVYDKHNDDSYTVIDNIVVNGVVRKYFNSDRDRIVISGEDGDMHSYSYADAFGFKVNDVMLEYGVAYLDMDELENGGLDTDVKIMVRTRIHNAYNGEIIYQNEHIVSKNNSYTMRDLLSPVHRFVDSL